MASMKRCHLNLRNTLEIVAVVIFVVGIVTSLLVYLSTAGFADTVSGSDLEEAKQSLRVLEQYGGRESLFACQFMMWFTGLWHGVNLAYTLAFLTFLLTFALFFVAYHLEPDAVSVLDEREK
jgi:hypothetical protein